MIRALSWIVLALGVLVLAGAAVMGVLAPTVGETLAWVVVEFAGVLLCIVGLHAVMDR